MQYVIGTFFCLIIEFLTIWFTYYRILRNLDLNLTEEIVKNQNLPPVTDRLRVFQEIICVFQAAGLIRLSFINRTPPTMV